VFPTHKAAQERLEHNSPEYWRIEYA
jgi:hypothetical protein